MQDSIYYMTSKSYLSQDIFTPTDFTPLVKVTFLRTSLHNFTGHYANTPMQYTALFHGCKNVNFQMKNHNIFLIFAQNIDCGYTLEPPH